MKSISSKSDLAINGAPPAFPEKLHVGRPNMGDKASFQKYVDKIFESKWLSNNGPLVQELEQRIANHHQVKHCVAMCNGTIALEIAIRALELTGEVILPSYTFIATAHALHWQEITPVFADIDPVTHCLDPDAVRKMITPKTTGIIGVHLWGHAAPVDELQEIADEHNLKLMFDAAHAFGCSYKGTMIGNFGEAEVLSFHATKFFNTFEGGAVLTNNDKLAEKMRLMRNFGFAGLDNVIHPGTNGKMTEINAAMGLVNLDNLNEVVLRNEENYRAYQQGLNDLPGVSVFAFDENEQNNFQYVVMEVGEDCPVNRDQIIEALHAENVLARKYFWPGCHKMLPYRDLYPHAELLLPITQNVADRVVVLPTGNALSAKSIETVCQIIHMKICKV
ncbi:Aminotransferase [Methylophaga lonarensis MPL]|uniref:Aminotransferase n=1 Tax=Methylophaga lonarensis MPL TaxID=1286106 RepID=M7PJM1_9GAMM|nr:DegT/DnrJ/EryC1/StrS family aminotransferase [Methylophaga lonarensis]EMR14100.1 Aminotransferase [Methylophaga lonarensis MPL]